MSDRLKELCAQYTEWLANVAELPQDDAWEILKLVEESCKDLIRILKKSEDGTTIDIMRK